jgi:hypothetical protein
MLQVFDMMCHPPWLGGRIQGGRAVLPEKVSPNRGSDAIWGMVRVLFRGEVCMAARTPSIQRLVLGRQSAHA